MRCISCKTVLETYYWPRPERRISLILGYFTKSHLQPYSRAEPRDPSLCAWTWPTLRLPSAKPGGSFAQASRAGSDVASVPSCTFPPATWRLLQTFPDIEGEQRDHSRRWGRWKRYSARRRASAWWFAPDRIVRWAARPIAMPRILAGRCRASVRRWGYRSGHQATCLSNRTVCAEVWW